MVGRCSLGRIEFTQSEGITAYDPKNHHCSSHCIVLFPSEGYHCWAEFLADGQWVPIDISEACKTPKLADYYFGHNPANRFELTKGRDLMVEPEPESGPINFLVYPLLEMNGEVIKPETTFEFRRFGA